MLLDERLREGHGEALGSGALTNFQFRILNPHPRGSLLEAPRMGIENWELSIGQIRFLSG